MAPPEEDGSLMFLIPRSSTQTKRATLRHEHFPSRLLTFICSSGSLRVGGSSSHVKHNEVTWGYVVRRRRCWDVTGVKRTGFSWVFSKCALRSRCGSMADHMPFGGLLRRWEFSKGKLHKGGAWLIHFKSSVCHRKQMGKLNTLVCLFCFFLMLLVTFSDGVRWHDRLSKRYL